MSIYALALRKRSRRVSLRTAYAAVLLILLCCLACSDSDSSGSLTLRNDIMDKEYNSFVIDKVVTSKGGRSFKRRLDPGEGVTLPYQSVYSFRLTRAYAEFDRVYHVKCPASLKKKTVIKLIDVHTNRIRGGCRLVKKGKRYKGGYTKWE